ncbi:MAG: hypothetical protein ABEJ26_14730 [Halosimplex sp.]
MEYVLNTHTETLHEPRAESSDDAACGALMHVPSERVERVSRPARRSSEPDRCGRCFPGEGGY